MSGIVYEQFSTIIPFLLLLFLGLLCGKNKILTADSVKTVGYVTVNYLTPFMVVSFLQIERNNKNSSEFVLALVAAVIIFFLYYGVAYLFFLKKKNDASNIHACALCSTSVSVFAYPLLKNVPGCNASLYIAVFILVNQLMFNIFAGKILYQKRSLLKRLFTIPFIIEILGVLIYFLNIRFPMPISHTINYVADIVPSISALLVGMFFSNYPASGFKFQLDVIIVSAFKLLLFPFLVFGICMVAKLDIQTSFLYVTLAGLPCGIDLPTMTAYSQNKNTARSANVTAFSFTLSIVSIPLMYFIVTELYEIVFWR